MEKLCHYEFDFKMCFGSLYLVQSSCLGEMLCIRYPSLYIFHELNCSWLQLVGYWSRRTSYFFKYLRFKYICDIYKKKMYQRFIFQSGQFYYNALKINNWKSFFWGHMPNPVCQPMKWLTSGEGLLVYVYSQVTICFISWVAQSPIYHPIQWRYSTHPSTTLQIRPG